MTVLNIRHRTTYRYRESVRLGPHRLMLRPRESRDVRLLSSTLEMTPTASISWTNDVFGNAVATAGFAGLADGLTIESRAAVELGASAWPVFDIAASAIHYPFFYSSDERADLGALAVPQTFDASGRLADWARGFVRGTRTDTLALLKDMVAGVAAGIGYQSREEEGTQTPLQTIDRGWGSCRDFAVLFAEAARSLGFGARIISGYLYNPDRAPAPEEAGSTHAWTEIFLPGAGWITFDPTNRAVGGYNLIPLAVGRVIAQVMPMTGTFVGMTDAYLGMSVDVEVTP
ncbi:Transglutaminase-like enzyme, putative cysteine protease [Rhodospirillales bacterium URHD0017]|nr:Transglutaminase-like enzyme, putative cysteine protease [Rhodospirillales bacterium URHD0017]